MRTDARVKKILTRNGRAVGVALENGEELRAPVVVTTIHPKIAFLDLLDRHELPGDFVWDIERWKTRSGTVKVNVAISELPNFTAIPGTNQQDHHTGSVELCLSPQYAERAFQDAHMERKAATAPFVDGTIPTTLDKKLAPEGTHVFSMFTQWVPDDWNTEPHRDELDAYAQRIFDGYNELAPNFKDSIIDYQVIGPYDMEQDLGLIGGNIFHGELSVDQLFHMRPAPGYADFRTPDQGALPRFVRHARRGWRQRHPRLAGVQGRGEGQGDREEVVKVADELCHLTRRWTTRGPRWSACSRRGPSPSWAPPSRSFRSAGRWWSSSSAAATAGGSTRSTPGTTRCWGCGAIRRSPRFPNRVDLAILGVSNARVEQALIDAVAAGARSAVTFSSLYEEPQDAPPLTEAHGRHREGRGHRALRRQRHGIPEPHEPIARDGLRDAGGDP